MFAHAIDSTSSYQIALADSAVLTMTATADDARPASAANGSIAASADWRVAKVDGVDGLCFVRRGTGGWNGVVTVCDGRTMRLAEVQRPSLQPAVFHQVATESPNASSAASSGSRSVPSSVLASAVWQRGAAYVLLAIGLGLAMKSGSMLLQGSRKYG